MTSLKNQAGKEAGIVILEEKRSLKSDFTELLIRKILSGELTPGDKLPPERMLAEQYGISRGSVNQGILDLERMGFLRVAPRHGNYVADYLNDTSPEITSAIMNYDSALIDPKLFSDLMAFRILLECECVQLAAQHINRAAVDELGEHTNRVFCAQESGLADALFEYHLFIVRLSGNKAYLMLFRSFEKMILKLIAAHYESSPAELEKSLPLYNELTGAISRGDSKSARQLMERILGYASDYLNSYLK